MLGQTIDLSKTLSLGLRSQGSSLSPMKGPPDFGKTGKDFMNKMMGQGAG